MFAFVRLFVVAPLFAVMLVPAFRLIEGQTVSFSGGQTALNFGNVKVCATGTTAAPQCAATRTLIYKVTASGTPGSVSVLTQGSPNLDFALLSDSTCTGALMAGATCTVHLRFAPRFAGLRSGAVQIVDGRGDVVATTMIHGVGIAPQVVFDQGVTTTLAVTGLDGSYAGEAVNNGLALDGAGNLYVTDSANGRILKLPADGKPQTAIGAGWLVPTGVALDGAGDLYVADSGNNRVVEIASGGGGQITVGTGLYDPTQVAVDKVGDLFIADIGNNRVVEVPADGAEQKTVYLGTTGGATVEGVAVDGLANVFISLNSATVDKYGDNVTTLSVVKLAPGGGQITMFSKQHSSHGAAPGYILGPLGLAVDGSGNLYVASYSSSLNPYGSLSQHRSVVEMPAGSTTQTTVFHEDGFYFFPYSVDEFGSMNMAVDGRGNLFFSDSNLYIVKKMVRSQPAALNFASTVVGSVSTDSPRSITVGNIGTASLTVAGLSVSEEFEQVAGTGKIPDCASGSVLAAGTGCNLSIRFAPKSVGTIKGKGLITDNSLNVAGVSQVVPLSGTGLASTLSLAVSPSTLQFGSVSYGSQKTLTLHVSNTGNGVVTIAPSINGPSYTITQNSCGTSIAVGGRCELGIRYSPVKSGSHTDLLTFGSNAANDPVVRLTGDTTRVAVPVAGQLAR